MFAQYTMHENITIALSFPLFLGPSRRKLPKSVVHRAFLLFDCFFSPLFFLFEEAAHTMGGCNCSCEEERKLMVGEEGAFGT
jgi:hypothetical protein